MADIDLTPRFRVGRGGEDVIRLVPYMVVAPNARWRHDVFDFPDQTVRASRIFAAWKVPSDYLTGATIVIVPTSSQTTGDVDYEVGYRVLDQAAGDSFDQLTTQETVTGSWTVPGTATNGAEIEVTLTPANFVAGRMVEMWIEREETSGAGWQIHDVGFRFSGVFEFASAFGRGFAGGI